VLQFKVDIKRHLARRDETKFDHLSESPAYTIGSTTPGIMAAPKRSSACARLSVTTNASTPGFLSLAPKQYPEDNLREQPDDKKYNEGDLASRNRYGDHVAKNRKHEEEKDMLENSYHFATPHSISTQSNRLR
jgi:hypothetical protein